MAFNRQGGFLIAKIKQLSGRIFARLLKEYGIDDINPAQGRIMFVLWQNDGISIKELARKTSLGKSTLTSMLDRLEHAGFLYREYSSEDRRKTLIWRTEKDRTFQQSYIDVSKHMNSILYKDFSESEIVEFEKYLERVYDNLYRSESGISERDND